MRYFIFAIILSMCPMASIADNLTSQQIGSFTYTNGFVNGQSYNTTTQKIGGFEYTNGFYGNQPINTSTQQIGNFKYTNGNLGGLGLSDDYNQ